MKKIICIILSIVIMMGCLGIMPTNLISAGNADGIVIIKQPVNVTVERNKLAYFEVKAKGKNLKYLWQKKEVGKAEWSDWNSKTTAAITVAYASYRDGMNLRCIVTDNRGQSIITNEVVLRYDDPIIINVQPQASTVPEGMIANFSVKASGMGLKYLWQKKEAGSSAWSNWDTKTKPDITIAYLASRDGMKLRCIITDKNGKQVISDEAELKYDTINISKQPVSYYASVNQLAYFEVEAKGNNLKYLWQKKEVGASEWSDWPTKTTPKICVAYAPYRNGMQLRCKVTNTNGCEVYSGNAVLYYTDGSPTKIAVFETSDLHGCLFESSDGNEDTVEYRLAYIAKIVDKARNDAKYDDVLLVDGGDIYYGDKVSGILKGSAMRAALDKMKYDAVTVGNREFRWEITEYGADSDATVPAYSIGEYEGDPSIPVIASNLYYSGTNERVGFTKDYVIVEKAGFRIAIIGYVDYELSREVNSNLYKVDSNLDNLSRRIKEINMLENPDATVLLTHSDSALTAMRLDPDEVQLVVGGHSHKGVYGISKSGVPYIQANLSATGYASAAISIDLFGNVTVENLQYTCITDNPEKLYDIPENADKFDSAVLGISRAAYNIAGINESADGFIKITKQPADTTVEEGELAYFEVKAEGKGLKYLWQKKEDGQTDWTDWNTKTKASISVAYTPQRNKMKLRCIVTDSAGRRLFSKSVMLTYKNSFAIVKQPSDSSVNQFSLAYFSVEAEGRNLKYLWQYREEGQSTWTDWLTKTTPSISVAFASNRIGMSVRCKVTDGSTGKSLVSDPAKLSFKPMWRIDRDDFNAWQKSLENVRFLTEGSYSFKALDEIYMVDPDYVPSTKGMDTLNISGSTQFSEQQFHDFANTLRSYADGDPVYVIDLRGEDHAIINGRAVSLYGFENMINDGKSKEEILTNEKMLFDSIRGKSIEVYALSGEDKGKSETVLVENLISEQELVESEGFGYLRLTAVDHGWPDVELLDTFIDFVKGLDMDHVWLHFHCQAGHGRTGALMCIYDMMKNPDVSLEDIVIRQAMTGSAYLFYTEQSNSYKALKYAERNKMVRLFYEYVQENHIGNYEVSWSEWLKSRELNEAA
ncbi:MAG: metallophosphoesterase [Lachnospiraceae bacterium]|nr:metallophosphoesterase [Lachnospiraceae bacterium]